MSLYIPVWERFKQNARYYLGGLWRFLNDQDIFIWAQAIAFKVLVTLVPLIILATGIVGIVSRNLVIEGQAPAEVVTEVIRDFFPSYPSDQLITFLRDFQNASDTLTFIGIGGLLFSAMTLFTTLRVVLASVFREEWHDHRTIFGGYLFDIRMVAQVGLFFLLSIGISVFVQQAPHIAFIKGLDAIVQTGWKEVFRIVGLLFPFILSTAMFFQLFYFTPKPLPPKRSVLVGSLVTALLWEVAKHGFTVYVARVGSFGGVGLAAGTFGVIIALVFWAYYSGIVFIIGAIITLLHETRYRQLPGPVGPFDNDPTDDEDILEDEFFPTPVIHRPRPPRAPAPDAPPLADDAPPRAEDAPPPERAAPLPERVSSP